MGSSHGVTKARIIHLAGTDDESIIEADALIQSESGFFEVDTPIFEGDIVEVPDPRKGPDGTERRLAKQVKVNNFGPRDVQHIQVKWGAAPSPRVAPIRRLTFENLHSEVQAVAGNLFADGQYEAAVSEAFKSIEVRVRQVTGLDKSGAALMADAFRPDAPLIDVAAHPGQSGRDEREGLLHVFRGAMIGIRNPKAHELFAAGDPQQALEYLGLASLLHRRIDGRDRSQVDG
jgi:uncharacterized protein (TIGR02391 family)